MDNLELSFFLRLKGLICSFLFSAPIAYALYFLLTNIQEIRSDAIPFALACIIILLFSLYSIFKPLSFVIATKNLFRILVILKRLRC